MLHSYYCFTGLATLKNELSRDYGEVNLNELCTKNPNSKEVHLSCFKSAGSLCDFVNNFYILSHKHGSEIFARAWKNFMLSAIEHYPTIDLNGVYPFVWQPCLESLNELLTSLSNLSMRLEDVDRNFARHKDDLNTQLFAVFKGVTESVDESFHWNLIERAILRIQQYWELCRYCQVANILLRIRDSLGLDSGDFSLVEKLAKEVITLIVRQYCMICLLPF